MPADFLPVFKSKVKFNHNEKLPGKFRMILVGASGSGKSFLFTQMLLQKNFLDYNKLYYYSKTYESQPEMKNIVEAFKKNLHKEDIIELFKQGINEDEFHEYVNDLSNELTQDQEVNAIGSSKLNEFIQSHEINKEKKNLLCVDDFQGNKRVGEIASDYFNNLRKYNVNMIYIGQRFMTVPKDVRSNANFIIGFHQPKDDSDWFYNNVLSRYMDKEEFKRLISKQWKQYKDGHSDYIAVNLETGNIYTDLFD